GLPTSLQSPPTPHRHRRPTTHHQVDQRPWTAQLGLTDGVLPRSIVAVAAWMVALRPEIADVVAPANAAALVESEVDLPPAARAAVVDALLADAREHEAPPRWSLDLSVVAHPHLARQLTDRLAAGVDQPFEAWWICRLALAGRISAVAPAALAIALDDRLPSWVRRPAIDVVTDLGSAPERAALLDGLKLHTDADPDDELRAGLLDGLHRAWTRTRGQDSGYEWTDEVFLRSDRSCHDRTTSFSDKARHVRGGLMPFTGVMLKLIWDSAESIV
ncbi:hypothetical protein, partial [Micromonospora arida]